MMHCALFIQSFRPNVSPAIKVRHPAAPRLLSTALDSQYWTTGEPIVRCSKMPQSKSYETPIYKSQNSRDHPSFASFALIRIKHEQSQHNNCASRSLSSNHVPLEAAKVTLRRRPVAASSTYTPAGGRTCTQPDDSTERKGPAAPMASKRAMIIATTAASSCKHSKVQEALVYWGNARAT